MSRPLVGLLAGLLFAPVGASADAVVGFNTGTPVGAVKGLFIDRPAGEPYAVGISWMSQGAPIWETGLDISQDYGSVPDLVLAFDPSTQSDELRIARDTGSVVIGPRIGHPGSGFQLELEPAGQSGLMVGTDGYAYSAYFYNHDAPDNNRTCLCLQNLWALSTDRGETGGTDFGIYDMSTGQAAVAFGQGGRIAFYGAAPTAKPTVSGSWADGSAARSTLAALVRLGLASDATTP